MVRYRARRGHLKNVLGTFTYQKWLEPTTNHLIKPVTPVSRMIILPAGYSRGLYFFKRVHGLSPKENGSSQPPTTSSETLSSYTSILGDICLWVGVP